MNSTSAYARFVGIVRVIIYWLILFITCSIGHVNAQTDSVIISRIITEIQRSIHGGDFIQSDALSDSVLQNYADVLNRELDLAATVYHLSFSSKTLLRKMKEARAIYEIGFRHLKQHDPPHFGGMAKLLMAYAGTFNANLQIDSILAYLNPAEDYLKKDSRDKGSLASLYYQKSRIAYNYSDYDGQVSYALKGLELQEKNFSHHHLMRISFCNAIGIGYRNLRQLDNAEKYFLLGLQTSARYPNEKSMHARISNNLGVVHMGKGNYEQAIEYISQAINYYRDYVSETDSEIGSGYDNLSECYQNLGDWENGERYARKSLSFILKNLRPNHRDLVLPYLTLGKLWMNNNRIDSAEYYFLMARDVLVNNGWTREDPAGNFIVEDPFEVFSHLVLLRKKQYEFHQDSNYLNLASNAMEDFVSTSQYAFQKYNTTTSSENYFESYGSTFDNALACLYYKYALDADKNIPLKGIRWIEQFKSIEMRYAYQRDKVKATGAYLTLNNQHQALQKNLSLMEDAVYDELEPSDSLLILLHQSKVNIHDWKQEILREWPAYFRLIYHQEINMDAWQKKLSDEESVVLYKSGFQSLFAIVVNKTTLNFYQLPFEDSLIDASEKWVKGINEFGTTAKYDENRLNELLHENLVYGRLLYKKLIEPLCSVLQEHLLIVPDGVLNYIPFSALLTKDVSAIRDIKQYPYLINEYKISYCHSLSLYREMKEKKIAPAERFLALAPTYKKSSELPHNSLQHNKTEAQLVGDLFDGTVIKDQRATVGFLRQHCSKYQVIHLAAHGLANSERGDRSFVALTEDTIAEGNLYAGDIYNLSLHAELVGLSACESGIGEIRNGEGMISLARAFSFAGAKSVLSSLWSVDDRSTAKLMYNFYRALLNEKSKDESMQLAAYEYIRSSNQVEAHPYYWAGFMLIGDASGLPQLSATDNWLVYLPILLIAGLIFIYIYKSGYRI